MIPSQPMDRMTKMRVLVACEYSGTVRDAFRKKGHDAYSCDLLPTESDPAFHYQCDVRDVAGMDWDMMIAHPPCTYLCSSGLHWNRKFPERSQKTEEAVDFVRWLWSLPINKIAIENPIGCLSTKIRKPDQIIKPYQYGHDAAKSTCLWLRNLPPLKPTNYIEPKIIIYNGRKAKRWANQTPNGADKTSKGPDRWKTRSLTFQGIADAMADQWG